MVHTSTVSILDATPKRAVAWKRVQAMLFLVGITSVLMTVMISHTNTLAFFINDKVKINLLSSKSYNQSFELERKGGIHDWIFTPENLKRDPKLQFALSTFSLKSKNLVSLSLNSPGVQGPTKINFFSSNPGWLSKRTFTADVFTCPPNSHEGTITHLYRQILLTDIPEDPPDPKADIVLDVGSNLGFYSLLPARLGFRAVAFDLQAVCLHGLRLLAEANGVGPLVRGFNLALSDRSRDGVASFGAACDYENYYVEGGSAGVRAARDAERRMAGQAGYRGTAVLDEADVGGGAKGAGVRMLRAFTLDQVIEELDAADREDHVRQGYLWPSVIRILKIDTEGSEAVILGGAKQLLASGRVKNLIIEVASAHWRRFGAKGLEDSEFVENMVALTEQFGYRAYSLYVDRARRPDASIHHVIRPATGHPHLARAAAAAAARGGGPAGFEAAAQRGVGCRDDAGQEPPFWEIVDLRRFLTDYCARQLATRRDAGGRVMAGFCGNLWFSLPPRPTSSAGGGGEPAGADTGDDRR